MQEQQFQDSLPKKVQNIHPSTSPISSITPIPPNPKNPNTSLKLLIILTIAFLVTAAFSGYLFSQNLKYQKKVAVLESKLQQFSFQSSPASPSSTPVTTADWQTYTNSMLGFTLKYPKDMILQEYSLKDSGPNVIGQFRVASIKQELPKRDYPFEVLISYFDSNLPLDEWYLDNYSKLVSPDDEVFKSDINVDGIKALRHSRKNTNLFPGYATDEIFLSYKGTIISIAASSIANSEEQEIYDQILSTFKFLG